MNDLILSNIPLTDFETLIRNCVKSELQSFSPAPPPQDQDELLTTAEAIKLLRVSKVTLSKWRTEGRIKFYRIASRIRFRKSELLDALTTPKKYGRKSNEPKEDIK
jgi:excisionase family DNA binding protein